jgi:hypothetical protein
LSEREAQASEAEQHERPSGGLWDESNSGTGDVSDPLMIWIVVAITNDALYLSRSMIQ